VTFSHGWPLNWDAWDGQMLFLAQHGFRVVAHDRRGHGRSSQGCSGWSRWPTGQHRHLPMHQAAPKPVATGPTTTTAFTRLNTAPVAEARHSTLKEGSP
jgi:pimeloyl-ACP methyl ester carboxylesterase